MLNKEFRKKRLEELIKEAEALLKIMPSLAEISAQRQDKNLLVSFDKWKLSCLNFLRSFFGTEHYFYKNFLKSIQEASWGEYDTIGEHKIRRPYYYSAELIAKGYAVLLFIKEQIELNLVSDVKRLYEAALFSNLIEQAFELLEKDYRNAAAIYGRIVIESTIRDLCRINNINTEDKKKMPEMLIELRKINVIDLPKERVIQAKYDIGSLAAHGKDEFNKYNNEDIVEMLEFIRDKIVTMD